MSEIARFRRRLEEECYAMKLGFEGPAKRASHTIINNRYRNLETIGKQLAEHVGEQAANEIVYTVYSDIMG
jgi:hypothetical protein